MIFQYIFICLLGLQVAVYLPALKNRPQSLYTDDINENHNHWWNRLMAGYFGKEAIHLQEEKATPNE